MRSTTGLFLSDEIAANLTLWAFVFDSSSANSRSSENDVYPDDVRQSTQGVNLVKVLGRRIWTLLIPGCILLSLHLWASSLPTYRGAPIIFLLGLPWLLFFCIGFVASCMHVFSSSKNLKVFSLIPLAITFGITLMALYVPRLAFPVRDVKFFRTHFSEYQNSIKEYSENSGNSKGDYQLPAQFRHLSDDGHMRVYSSGEKANYYYMYQKVFMGSFGIIYAPNGLISTHEYVKPVGDHPGWYYAGDG